MPEQDAKEGFEKPKSESDIIKEAIAFYAEDYEFELQNRKQQDIDARFQMGQDHWEKRDRNSRKKNRRPMLTILRMNEFLNHVKNENRQNKPGIKISPAAAQDEEMQKKRIKWAKNRQGLVKHIQYSSRAQQAYTKAFDDAVNIGRGWFMIETEYVSNESFNQKIVISRIAKAQSVVPDRNRKEVDYRDMKRCFITETLSRERFKADYPGANPSNWNTSLEEKYWMSKNDIMIANYYCVRYRKRKLLGLDTGENFYDDELDELGEDKAEQIRKSATKKREIKEPYIKCYKMTSVEVLDEFDIPGFYIPIIPVIGVEEEVDGEVIIKGMTRDLRDPQKLYNYWASTEAELLTLAPKAPYIGAAGQVAPYKKMWENANISASAVLLYKEISVNGTLVPAPRRVDFAPVPTGVVNAKAGNIDDMRAITGLHAPSMGMESSQSGRAVLAEQRSGDTATYHFTDNLGFALTHAGVIINQWLPIVLDTARIERILGDDDEEDTLSLGEEDENGDMVELGTGEFDVVVSMGPSYATQRQEAAESMMAFLSAVPQAAPFVYDIMVKNMDWPEADVVAARLRKTVPPEVLEQEGGEEKMAQQLQALIGKVKQYESLIPELAKQLEKTMAELDDKGAEIEKDLEIQDVKSATAIAVANINAEKEKEKSFQATLKEIRSSTPQKTTE